MPPDPARVGERYAVAAVATSGLPVAFASATNTVCRVSGSTVSFSRAGTCTVRASQGGNSSYTAAPRVTQRITVGALRKGRYTVTFDGVARNQPLHLQEVGVDDLIFEAE